MSKLWEKENSERKSDARKEMESFTVGKDYLLDQVLVPYDLKASSVHAEALHGAGVLTVDELHQLKKELNILNETWKRGEFRILMEDEDMHTVIEYELVRKLGGLGKKIHAGRSRNDQVLTALRLYEKEKLSEVLISLHETAGELLQFAEKHEKLPMPGFTHTRKAMLSSVGLWAGAYIEMMLLQLDAAEGIKSLIDRSPLGTAAGFGTTFPIDREKEALDLGFRAPIICSTTSQLSRGWVELQLVQYLFGITSIINRFASDIILYTGEGFPFFKLHPDVTTGSSIMPQKKNPDLAELIRGRHAEVSGAMAILQSLTTNLTSGYHRDLQLTKEPVINAIQNSSEILSACRLLIRHIIPIQKNLEEACTSEIFAAEEAHRLVKLKGYSFREAYLEIKTIEKKTAKPDWNYLMEGYTHLGTPGNTGLYELKRWFQSKK